MRVRPSPPAPSHLVIQLSPVSNKSAVRTRMAKMMGKGAVQRTSRLFANLQPARRGRSSSEAREPFEREARVISNLNHPHTCQLYDVGNQDGIHFLVMEYLEGETLAARVAKGPLALEQASEYAIQIAEALHKAYTKGVTHCDLKPANVMLTPHGAKLLDF